MMNKETIKEFLKPDLGKVLIFFVILNFSFVSEGFSYEISKILHLPNEIRLIWLIFYAIVDLPALICMTFRSISLFFSLPLMISRIFWWYLLSCLIISTYDRLKIKIKGEGSILDKETEFFKPNFMKVVVTITYLFILVFVFIFWWISPMKYTSDLFDILNIFILELPRYIVGYILQAIGLNTDGILGFLIIPLIFIFWIIYTYLIACSVLWVFDKVRGKKQ